MTAAGRGQPTDGGTPSSARGVDTRAAWCVVACGIAAALHAGKLPPAIPALQAGIGLGLVESGWLLALIQGASMVGGLALALVCTRVGLRRAFAAGLGILATASALGSAAQGSGGILLARAAESIGLLLVVTSGPALVRAVVPPARQGFLLAAWSTFMPAGVATAMLAAPWVLAHGGWERWWQACAVPTALALVLLLRVVPAQRRSPGVSAGSATLARQVLATPGAHLVGLAFGLYSGLWLVVVGFLPTMLTMHGIALSLAAYFGALTAISNVAGNLMAGVLLQRGVAARALLAASFALLLLALLPMFADAGQPLWLRIAAAIVFSAVGGLIPGTLFPVAARVAPSELGIAATTGWMVQLSSVGQMLVPPLVAARVAAGGWTAVLPVAGGVLAAAIAVSLLIGPARFRR